jgi:hypothetical protein
MRLLPAEPESLVAKEQRPYFYTTVPTTSLLKGVARREFQLFQGFTAHCSAGQTWIVPVPQRSRRLPPHRTCPPVM